MSTDRELLELAAKAAGIEYDVEASKPHPMSGAWFGLWLVIHGEPNEFTRRRWNPLADDGDALRLAVKLEISLCFPFLLPQVIKSVRACADCFEAQGRDPFAATRRAIVRAAAESGKAML